MDNPPGTVESLLTTPRNHRVSLRDAAELSPACASVYVVDDPYAYYDPDKDGQLLRAGEVLRLLNLRSRTSLGEWRERGDLLGYRMRSGHYLYPANQTVLNEARAVLGRPYGLRQPYQPQQRRAKK